MDLVDRILAKYADCPNCPQAPLVNPAPVAVPPSPPVKRVQPVGAALEGVAAASLPKIAEFPYQLERNRDASYKPQVLSRTYSNKKVRRQVDPALQIGGPGRDGMTAEIFDPRVEHAYRSLLQRSGVTSPRDERTYNRLLWRARTSVYGPE